MSSTSSDSLTPGGFSLTKLPKWAQREITSRDLRIRDLEKRLREIHEPSRVSVAPYDQVPLYLPEHAPVDWQMSEDDATFGRISVHLVEHPLRPPRLLVHGGTSLIVRPSASNCVELYLDQS